MVRKKPSPDEIIKQMKAYKLSYRQAANWFGIRTSEVRRLVNPNAKPSTKTIASNARILQRAEAFARLDALPEEKKTASTERLAGMADTSPTYVRAWRQERFSKNH